MNECSEEREGGEKWELEKRGFQKTLISCGSPTRQRGERSRTQARGSANQEGPANAWNPARGFVLLAQTRAIVRLRGARFPQNIAMERDRFRPSAAAAVFAFTLALFRVTEFREDFGQFTPGNRDVIGGFDSDAYRPAFDADDRDRDVIADLNFFLSFSR